MGGWTIHVSSVPVAITAANPAWPSDYALLLHKLANAFGFGLRQIDDVWRSCHDGGAIDGYILDLCFRAEHSLGAATLRLERVEVMPGTHGKQLVHAVIGVACEALAEETDRDIGETRASMAEAVRGIVQEAGIAPDAAGMVAHAWMKAPATLAVQIQNTPTVRNDLRRPVHLDAALISETDRQIARMVREAGIEPGTYRGDGAKTLDRDTLAPIALGVLIRRLAAHDMNELVLFGMQELERITAYRDKMLRGIGQSARLLYPNWDPASRYQEQQAEYLILRRCAEMGVEAALRLAPVGNAPVDDVAWSEILAGAHAYLSATARSENIHHQVTPTALHISDSFEMKIVPDNDAAVAIGDERSRIYDLDTRGFGAARAALELVEATDHALTSSDRDDESMVAPELDAAMRDAYGVSASDIYITLFALAGWPLRHNERDVATVTPRQVTDHVLKATILGGEADGMTRVAAAVSMLSSNAAELRAADWKPWHARTRKRRLLIQPLPQLSDGSIVVAPHFCLCSLSVYRNYLSQGQLPWSQPPAPRKVERALEGVRNGRNKALERQVAQLLRDSGWSVIEAVSANKPQRLNVPSLTTEIDAVAGRADLGTLWLLEVKDPVDTFAVPEIRRHLDHFYVGLQKPSYTAQLHRKVADIAPHANAVAQALGLPPRTTGSPFVVKPLFVTRKPIPAAFVTSDFEFVSIESLLSRLADG
ncbi:hypothetical protein [Microbispora sp. H13382]|uniref:hypothetical protein n=1 Tax=Microbispora sp. H13382 TaxID=2729112 RepID=UPI00160165E6|nr:hypothetical protein [Microbispora sp. H13382]